MSQSIFAGPWLGALTHSGVSIKAAAFRGVERVRVLVSQHRDLSVAEAHTGSVIWADQERRYRNEVVGCVLEGLEPDTEYHYVLEINGEAELDRQGRFRTLPAPGRKAGFRFAFGSCSGNDSFLNFGFPHTEAFEAIALEEELRFFVHLGDLHYGNIDDVDIAERVKRYEWFLEMKPHGLLFRNLPIAYVWDDHDFLGNNSGGGEDEFRDAARSAFEAYDLYVPHFPFANRRFGVAQAFTVGMVRFILPDLRFNKTSRPSGTGIPRQVLGDLQRKWLFTELLEAGRYDLVVIGGSFPWMGSEDDGGDAWAGNGVERRQIADFIHANGIRNVCMISGDAHMLAIDDGSNNRFDSQQRRGFPVFHAAALDSIPSRKGGTYSIGKENGQSGKGVADKRQYGVFDVRYNSDGDGNPDGPAVVSWSGKRAVKDPESNAIEERVRTVMTYSFTASEAIKL